MFKGHVDLMSMTAVAGWAANDEAPGEPVELSIFVDETKVAQILCADPRADLRQMGAFGAGNHGFFFEFPVRLPADRDTRLLLRFTTSGQPVPPGEVLLSRGRPSPVRGTSRNVEAEPSMLPAPRTPRDLFRLLGLLDEKGDVYSLLTRIAFRHESMREVLYTAFGEMPTKLPEVKFSGTYAARDDLYEQLGSENFQRQLIPLFLQAYPDKRRLIFVHIPKCAGTDLTQHFKQRYPSLDRNITDLAWTSKKAMLRRIGKVAVYAEICRSIFVCGHCRLADYTAERLIRPCDHVFTIMRAPFEIALSAVNYVLTRFAADIDAGEPGPDTKAWLAMLRMEMPKSKMSDNDAREIGAKILRQSAILPKDSLCHWAGEGDAQSAIDLLLSNDVEVTDTNRYNAWLQQRWDIRSPTRRNKSRTFLEIETLSRQDVEYIRDMTREDAKLYGMLQAALSRTGTLSVRGSDLARARGSSTAADTVT